MTDASKLAKIFLHEFGSGPHNTAHIENAKRDYAIGICKVLNALPELLAELGEAKAELERERMRLAACGIVAICNTRESAAQARDMHPDYRSASCDDVARSVDREMTLRKSLATLTRQRDGLKKALDNLCRLAVKQEI